MAVTSTPAQEQAPDAAQRRSVAAPGFSPPFRNMLSSASPFHDDMITNGYRRRSSFAAENTGGFTNFEVAAAWPAVGQGTAIRSAETAFRVISGLTAAVPRQPRARR